MIPFIKSGQVKALAVTSRKRSPELPVVPTLDESGLKTYETIAWFGLLAPAATPKPIVDKIQAEAARIVQLPDIRQRITVLGGEPVGNTPEQLAAIIHGDIVKWKKVLPLPRQGPAGRGSLRQAPAASCADDLCRA